MNGMCPIFPPNTKLLCIDVKVKTTEIAQKLNSRGGKQTTRGRKDAMGSYHGRGDHYGPR